MSYEYATVKVPKTGSGKYRCSCCNCQRWRKSRPNDLPNWVCGNCRENALGDLSTVAEEWLDEIKEQSHANNRKQVMYYILEGLYDNEQLAEYVAKETVAGYTDTNNL